MFYGKPGIVTLIALISASFGSSSAAFATSYSSIVLNGSYDLLHECGGTISATAAQNFNGSDAINIHLANVKLCSNFLVKNTHGFYKIPGPDGDRGGSISISVGRLPLGKHTISLAVTSDHGTQGPGLGHQDLVTIQVTVFPTLVVGPTASPTQAPLEQQQQKNKQQQQGSSSNCYNAAKTAALRVVGGERYVWAVFEGVTPFGDLVYDVTVNGAGVYQIVTTKSCEVISAP